MDDRLAFEVELFADLMVQIDDPFAEREAVFIASGIDESTHRNLVEGWRLRFDRDDTGSLASRFAERYEARRGALLDARRREIAGEVDTEDPRFLNADVQSFREEAAKVARDPLTEDTPPRAPVEPADPPAIVERPAERPREVPSFALAAVQLAAAPLPVIDAAPVNARPPASFAGTMDISHAVPKTSLPFAPASEPRAAEPAPPSVSRPHVPTGTADISALVPRDLLPFPEGGRPAPPAPPAPPRPQVSTGTADISAVVPRDLLPFPDSTPPRPAPIAEPPPPSVSAPPSIGSPVARPPQRFAGTADISAFVPRAATPFAVPPPPAAAPVPPAQAAALAPRKRLIRFDPQTGQPLPTPIWVDLPPEPEAPKK